tara:strand:+ start:741 stop:1553 length:813 start_codon:yes stop_codon:yes gene_type:complete
MKIGFMQGRLVPTEKKGTIQFFPSKNWKKELFLAEQQNLKLMEWTINIENIKKNPLYFFDKKNISKLKKRLIKNKVKVESVTCDFFMQRPFFKNKKNIYVLDILKRIIKNSKLLGIKYVILPLVDKSSIKNSKQEKLIIENLLKISKNIHNLKILFEIDFKPKKTLIFIKKFNKKFGINYDTGNSSCLNFNFDDEKKYFEYVKNIHIKDRILNGKTIRLGYGNWKPKQFFKYLKQINYTGNLILQTARAKKKNDDIGEILINIEFIKKYI